MHPDNPREVAAKTKPLTGDEYDEVRDAMHDRDFSSAEYALSHKLPPREVNAAVRSTDYDDYLDNR